MYEEFSSEEKPSEDVDKTILHVQELLDDGFYDKESCDEAIAMLNVARLSTEDPQARKQINTLLKDIEVRYGKTE